MVSIIDKSNITASEHPTLEAAIHYCNMGWSVIPIYSVKTDGSCMCGKPDCKKIGKHPIIAWKEFTKRRMTEREVVMHWRRNPDCNVGIVTGAISGIIVIDIDGEEGVKSLEGKTGIPLDQMPITPTVLTPGGGYHLYYRYKNDLLVKTRIGVLDHVDIKSDGGYVVAPPSVHRSGGTYK